MRAHVSCYFVPNVCFFCPVCVLFVPTAVCLFCPVCVFLSRRVFFDPTPGRCSLQELQAGLERWESKVVLYEKLKGKLDDEIKRVESWLGIVGAGGAREAPDF